MRDSRGGVGVRRCYAHPSTDPPARGCGDFSRRVSPRMRGAVGVLSAVAAWLIGIFQSLPAPAEAEPPAERAARIAVVAHTIAAETHGVREAALVAVTVWEESDSLRRSVHAGERRGDGGKATCLGQIHAQLAVRRAEWLTLHGTDAAATRRCIAATVRLYRLMGARCDRRGDTAAERLARRAAAYATGRTCSADGWKGAWRRAWRAERWVRLAPGALAPCSRELPCAVAVRAAADSVTLSTL